MIPRAPAVQEMEKNMSYLIFHPKRGWYCKCDYGRREERYFTESHDEPGVAVWFDTLELARAEFRYYLEKHHLEIYLPTTEKGKKLFPGPST